MITPEEARRISDEHPNEELQRLIEMTEQEIEKQTGKGRRRAMIHYTDNCYVREAAEHFERRGFRIEVYSEVLGGVRQHSAYYACW